MSFGLLLGLGVASASADDRQPVRTYLIGNSLTWDTVPSALSGPVQWHVDCGVSLPVIRSKTEPPCVASSTVWPTALAGNKYDIVSVQPHYGSTLSQDVEVISGWMEQQPQAVFVIHSGWAWHAQRAREFASFTVPDVMTHCPIYVRALIAELRKKHPGREIRQTLAQNLLAVVAEDIDAGRAPFKNVSELYRDDIHMTHEAGKYLMHNAMRLALGQAPSAKGFEKLSADVKSYLDGVLAPLQTNAADRAVLSKILSPLTSADLKGLIAQVSNADLRARLTALQPELQRAVQQRLAGQSLEADIKALGGRVVFAPTGPQWLYLATGDTGTEVFDVPVTIDLYNGNNPLKGKGGRNEQVTDDWLRRLATVSTLKRLDLSNCAVKGPGLEHIAGLTGLREINLTLTPVSDDALRHLAGMTELRSLGLASTQCTGTGFEHLKALKQLESVNLHFTPLNDAGLAAISQVPISDRLWFAHTKFTDAGAVHLSRQTLLKRCGIGSADKGSSGEAVAALINTPLEDLALLDNQATPMGLAHAAKIKTLRKLDASHAPTVKDDSLPLIAQMPKLEEFKLGSAQITDEGLQALAASTSLKRLTLTGLKHVTPAGIEKLKKARPMVVEY